MNLLRSERIAALLLIAAAAAGLIIANSGIGEAALGLRDSYLDIPWLGLHLSVGHWVTDGLLAIFFFIAAIELRHELTHGELDSPRKALIPMVAAVGGVIGPALLFLVLVRDPELAAGWPIPTATDIAFALGVLALVGRGLPARVRALLLALAVIDDLIAILIIAFFFTTDLNPLALIAAIPLILLFGWFSYKVRGPRRNGIIVVLVVLGLATWVLIHLSGVHATIAGVALGLIMAPASAGRARHALEPWSNGVILPVFALVASLVSIPNARADQLTPVFWAILLALPVGKLVGITAGAVIASRFIPRAQRRAALPFGDVLVVASLGGIGFTVSLLMNELAYHDLREIAAEGTLAVLAGSMISALVGAAITMVRARQHKRMGDVKGADTVGDIVEAEESGDDDARRGL